MLISHLTSLRCRLQLTGEGTKGAAAPSPLAVARGVIKSDGFLGLYAGYSAAITRQVVYGSARLGLFRVFSERLKEYNKGQPIPITWKIGAGLGSGALAAAIGNPADLSLVRMQADSILPAAERRNYKGVGDAVMRIIREEGVTSLWKGSSPTVGRAMALNAAMLATSDQLKEAFAPHLGGINSMQNLIASSAIAGVVASFASLPFDMIKTRLQKQKPNPDGTLPYAGLFDCARQIAVKEGPLAFYKGIGTYIVRIAPHAFMTLIFLDAANRQISGVVKGMREKEAGAKAAA